MSIDIFKETGIITGEKTGDLEMVLDIVCVHCGDKRGEVTLNYVSDNDRGLFRAKVICENCIKTGKTSLEDKE